MNTKDLKRQLRLSPLANSELYHLFRYYMKRDKMKGMMKKIGADAERERETAAQMKKAMVKYRWDFDEYVMYHFAELSDEERLAFVPEYEKNIFCDQVNDCHDARIFDSKWESYVHFKDYYKRNCVRVEDGSELQSFLIKHRDFIMKPDSSACGRGIQVIHSFDEKDAVRQAKKFFDKPSGGGKYIIEELIENEDIMASLHPKSLNTVRIPTIRYNDRVEIIHPFLRMGCGDAVVDNAGSGGIMGNVDVLTGVVYAAADEQGRAYTQHPDTGIELIGFTIPRWQEAVEQVKKMAMVLPSVRYVGWDMALTNKNGWVMIEGNDKGQFVFQVADRKGFRDEFDKIRKELLEGVQL